MSNLLERTFLPPKEFLKKSYRNRRLKADAIGHRSSKTPADWWHDSL